MLRPRGSIPLPIRRSACAVALAAGAIVASPAGAAFAEDAPAEVPRTLDPSGRQPIERGAPPDPYAPPAQRGAQQQRAQPPGEGEPAAAEAEEDSGFYYHDGLVGSPRRHRGGQRPARHEVRRGDTLWDITQLYFRDPFEWPRVWSLNPHITNPHWIYPGDEVRLRDGAGGDRPSGETDGAGPAVASGGPTAPAGEQRSPLTTSFVLRQIAFVDRAGLDVAARVAGAPTERELLVAGDTIYLDDVGPGSLRPGEAYAIYTEEEEVSHPHSGERVGAYVKLLGELEIANLRDGERAVARITHSVDVVERGARVGELKRRFTAVDDAPPSANVRGTIVATIEIGELVGQNHLVVMDRGASAGVEVGNPLYVVRRGDGFTARMGPLSHVGQDDERYPSRIIGQIRIVEVSDATSLGWVTSSALEVGVGDRVIMRADLD